MQSLAVGFDAGLKNPAASSSELAKFSLKDKERTG
jgi:hypothetical protein